MSIENRKRRAEEPLENKKDLYSPKVMTKTSSSNMDQETHENNGNEDDKFINGF